MSAEFASDTQVALDVRLKLPDPISVGEKAVVAVGGAVGISLPSAFAITSPTAEILPSAEIRPVSYTHLTLPTTPYV